MIEPVICARTTSGRPVAKTNSAKISSAILPKLTFNSPPSVAPARSASCSVASRSHSASAMIAIAALQKSHTGPAPRR